MKKVCFLSWHYKTPEIFLDLLKRMTPGYSGKWKDMVAVTKPYEADFCIVFDGYSGDFPKNRAIYVGQHPKVEGYSPAFRTFEDRQALARIRLDKYLNPGEIWIEYTYDELSHMMPHKKDASGTIACIMTYQTHNPMYEQRIKFMEGFMYHVPQAARWLDLYGRPAEKFNANQNFKWVYCGALGKNKPDGTLNEHTQGKNILKHYKYSLEFDVGPTKNYISERFYDAMLLWCIPIYFGSTNVHEFLPPKSFQYIDIYDTSPENYKKLFQSLTFLTKNDIFYCEGKITPIGKAMTEARWLLLNKYQIWPYMYDVINNLENYQ